MAGPGLGGAYYQFEVLACGLIREGFSRGEAIRGFTVCRYILNEPLDLPVEPSKASRAVPYRMKT